MIKLTTPIAEETIRQLHCGDIVSIDGIIVTARDAGHKLMASEKPEFLNTYLKDGIIYHCGPIVRKKGDVWTFVAAGPTTSIREELYEAQVIEQYGVRGIIGKGGMGRKTLEACKNFGTVYFHAVGGAGTLIAQVVKEILNVYKLQEFGSPEAFWICRVEDFPAIVTMDSYGNSLYTDIEEKSRANMEVTLRTYK